MLQVLRVMGAERVQEHSLEQSSKAAKKKKKWLERKIRSIQTHSITIHVYWLKKLSVESVGNTSWNLHHSSWKNTENCKHLEKKEENMFA